MHADSAHIDDGIDASPTRVMVAMSGGVDSSVCALLLAGDGMDICGVTGKMMGSKVLGDDEETFDSFLDDVNDAKDVCRKLSVPHYTFNYKDVFEKSVVDDFVDSYLDGRTPNPCIRCNTFVKFGAMQRHRAEMGCDYLATGHYARIRHDEETGRWQLLRAACKEKDQSYFLYGLTQDQLAHTLFPLGEMGKDEVRAIALSAGLDNSDKRESQDICFIPDGDYVEFIGRWTGMNGCCGAGCPSCGVSDKAKLAFSEGDVVDLEGNVLGRHSGLVNYTVGQRKGIGIAAPEPLYVIGKDVSRNRLVVGTAEQLLVEEVRAKKANFVSIDESAFARGPIRVLAKCSYRQEPASATASYGDGILTVLFDEKIKRPAPGQALVLYDPDEGEALLCGATII